MSLWVRLLSSSDHFSFLLLIPFLALPIWLWQVLFVGKTQARSSSILEKPGFTEQMARTGSPVKAGTRIIELLCICFLTLSLDGLNRSCMNTQLLDSVSCAWTIASGFSFFDISAIFISSICKPTIVPLSPPFSHLFRSLGGPVPEVLPDSCFAVSPVLAPKHLASTRSQSPIEGPSQPPACESLQAPALTHTPLH